VITRLCFSSGVNKADIMGAIADGVVETNETGRANGKARRPIGLLKMFVVSKLERYHTQSIP
jgi:hypothetical protein